MPPNEKQTRKDSATPRPRRSDARAVKRSEGVERPGKISACPRSRSHSARALGSVGKKRPLLRLLGALEAEKLPYMIIGMAAAAAQGVMANTLDIDIWVDLPPRNYMRVQNLARRLGATVAANTVVFLQDGTPVNFVYKVTGVGTFARETRYVTFARIHGKLLPVMPLARILQSKKAVGRDKDKLHITLIKDFLRCRREVQGPKGAARTASHKQN